MFRGQNSADEIGLRSGMDFIQMLLGSGLRHKVLDAFIEGAFDDQIRACAEREANTFTVDRWPFSESCGSLEIDLSRFIGHPYRRASSPKEFAFERWVSHDRCAANACQGGTRPPKPPAGAGVWYVVFPGRLGHPIMRNQPEAKLLLSGVSQSLRYRRCGRPDMGAAASPFCGRR
jgi:hypothetical protein